MKILEKIKVYFSQHFNKKSFLAVTVFVLIHGLAAVFAIAGITSVVKKNQNSEVIVLPEQKTPEEVFKRPTESVSDGVGLEKNAVIAQKSEVEKTETAAEPIEMNAAESETESDEEETVAVFGKQAEEFVPELPDGEILNDYTGDKLIKSKTMDDWRSHRGIDIKKEPLSEVKAAESGTVEKVYDDKTYGKTVVISHSNGFTTVYSNLDKDIKTEENKEVSKGDIIGKVGETALSEKEEAPHLHFEMLKDGEQINPTEYK